MYIEGFSELTPHYTKQVKQTVIRRRSALLFYQIGIMFVLVLMDIHEKAFINGELQLSEDRQYETGKSNLLNIGGFLSNRETL